MQNLKDKVALVTGGGRGLGAALCEVLVREGVSVAVADCNSERAEYVVSQLKENYGRAQSLHLDVGDERQVQTAVEKIVDEYGRLDILINNAGIDVTLPVEELSIQDWDRIVQTNLRGPFLLSKSVFPLMKKQENGHIVNVVSTAAKRAWANASAYHASKWGLLGFSHALHVEGRPNRVKVTAVITGGMRTGFLLDRFPEIDTSTLQDPRNVAETICFMLTQPPESVVPELTVIPMRETSWP